MNYFYLPSFKTALKKLKKKKAYKKIADDLITFLTNKTKEQLLQKGVAINKDDELFALHKFRLRNSVSGKGSSSGFRLYLAITISDKDNVILCTIYPKDGSKGKENLTAKEVIELLESINKEVEKLNNLENLRDW